MNHEIIAKFRRLESLLSEIKDVFPTLGITTNLKRQPVIWWQQRNTGLLHFGVQIHQILGIQRLSSMKKPSWVFHTKNPAFRSSRTNTNTTHLMVILLKCPHRNGIWRGKSSKNLIIWNFTESFLWIILYRDFRGKWDKRRVWCDNWHRRCDHFDTAKWEAVRSPCRQDTRKG